MIWVRLWLLSLIWLILTLPSLATNEVFSFAVFGDNQGFDRTFDLLLTDLAQERDLAFAVCVGDAVQGGQKEEYRTYIKKTKEINLKIYQVPGNHDLTGPGEKNWPQFFGSFYYSFDYGNSHFIILNNAFGKYFDRQQFVWLKNDLASNHQRHTFVFMHRPTFDPTEIYTDYVMSGREVIQQLMQLFEKYKVDYVFAGHVHGYAKAVRNDVVYIVTAGAGAPLYLPRDFGGFHNYVRINVVRDKVYDKVIRLND